MGFSAKRSNTGHPVAAIEKSAMTSTSASRPDEWPDADTVNFLSPLLRACEMHPERLALRIPVMQGKTCLREESLTFGEFAASLTRYQQVWHRFGLAKGDRVIVLLRPSLALYLVIASLASLGIVTVLIDTGMGRKKIRQAIEDSGARHIVSMKQLLRLWWILPMLWPLKRLAIDGKGWGYRHLLKALPQNCAAKPELVPCQPADHGLISFTSGSTGRPKGADRNQGSLLRQHLAFREIWPTDDHDIDLPCFPVLVLHNLSCGITTVMPRVDLAAPGHVDPEAVVHQILTQGITRLSGAPAYMERITTYMQDKDLAALHVRSVLCGGSTVSPALMQSCLSCFPNALCEVVYGSTEAEPIAVCDMRIALSDSGQQSGHLVGLPAAVAEVMIANPEARLSNESEVQAARCPDMTAGEILVSGLHVLPRYIDNPAANAETKIPRPNGLIWHRTGDAGFFDAQGRLWLVGRVKDAVIVDGRRIYTYPLEMTLDADPAIRRAALIQYHDTAVLIVELHPGAALPLEQIRRLLMSQQLASISYAQAENIPVDGRHNSKVDRPLLRQWLSEGRLAPHPL